MDFPVDCFAGAGDRRSTAKVHAAPEPRSVLEQHTRRPEIPRHIRRCEEGDPVLGCDIAAYRPLDSDPPSCDRGVYVRLRADREGVEPQLHGAFEAALDAEVLVSRDLALDPDPGGDPRHRGGRGGSGGQLAGRGGRLGRLVGPPGCADVPEALGEPDQSVEDLGDHRHVLPGPERMPPARCR